MTEQSRIVIVNGSGGPPSPRRIAVGLGVCTFVLMIPVTLIVPVLKELVAERFDAGVFWTHSFMFTNLIGAVLATPLIAMLCDRTKSRVRIAAIALTLDAALFAAMCFAPTLVSLLLLRGLEGAAHMLALSAIMATAADHAPSERRGRAMGLLGACMMFGTAAGTRIGGVVWKHLGEGYSLPISAAVSLLAALLVLMLLRDAAGRATTVRLKHAIALLRTHRRLGIPFAYTFIDRFCVGVIITSFGLFLSVAYGESPDGISRLLVMFLIPFAVGIYPAGRVVDRIGHTLPLALGSILFGLLFASYGVVPRAWLPLVMVASGLSASLMFAPTLSLCAQLAPRQQRGAAYAGFNAAGSLGMICGPLGAGLICHLLEPSMGAAGAYRAAFTAAGASQVVCAAITLPFLLAMRKTPRVDSRAGGALPAT